MTPSSGGTTPFSGGVTPFSTVDELGCYFDSPAEPNNIHFELHLSGHLDPARLRTAVLDTLAAYPAARARRGRWHAWDRRLHWEIAERPDVPPVEVVHWRDTDELAGQRERLLAAAPPLDLAPPLRVRHAVGTDWDALLVNVHHAAMDGLSGLRLLRSIARRYTGGPDPVDARPVGVRAAAHGHARSLRPAVRIAPDGGRPAPGCGFHLLSLPIDDVHSGRTTVNDVLVAALVVAVGEWNRAHGAGAGSVRVTMPVDARVHGQQVGNLSRLTVIAGEPGLGAARLLADVARQTAAAKMSVGPQVDPLTGLLAAPWLPVAVKARLPALALRLAGGVSDTTLLSNLGRVGDPPDFGAATTATGLWMSSPVRMPRGVSVGTVTVRDRLHVCFRYRKALFDRSAAARFADTFVAALHSFDDPRFGSRT
jgi:NRPS condensation-like uncharacterized protein